jgi:hypothetical protein
VSLTRTDRDHLRVLSICHYVLCGLHFFGGLFAALYFLVVFVFITEAPGGAPPNGPSPEFLGWLFLGIAAFVMLQNLLLAVGLALSGYYMGQRRRRTFCLVTAGFCCLGGLLGIALGIFTFIVLLRPSVREAFEYRSEEPSEFDAYHSD